MWESAPQGLVRRDRPRTHLRIGLMPTVPSLQLYLCAMKHVLRTGLAGPHINRGCSGPSPLCIAVSVFFESCSLSHANMQIVNIGIICYAVFIAFSQCSSLNRGNDAVAVRSANTDTSSSNNIFVRKAFVADPPETRQSGMSVASCKSFFTTTYWPTC